MDSPTVAMRFTLSSLTVALLSTGSALAADLAAPAPAPVAVVEHCKATLSLPAYGGVIKPNPNPTCFTLGGFGDIYVGGAITGYAYTQSNPFPFSAAPLPSDRAARVDFTNIQGWIQKADGPFQFYVQAGAYAIPALGFANYSALDQTDLLFTPLPVAFGKYVFNDQWSIQGGRMPTLIGTEAPFTFQNLNISRGLLFNQENIINHGVQVNYADGPWSASVAGTDGFFSGNISWLTGAITYKLDDNNTFGINGGLNLDRTDVLARSIRYAYATRCSSRTAASCRSTTPTRTGRGRSRPTSSTRTSPATTGSASSRAPRPMAARCWRPIPSTTTSRSPAASSTSPRPACGMPASPTCSTARAARPCPSPSPRPSFDRFFVRGEYSRVQLYDITRGDLAFGTLGSGFGRTGNRTSQDRYMIEGGITF